MASTTQLMKRSVMLDDVAPLPGDIISVPNRLASLGNRITSDPRRRDSDRERPHHAALGTDTVPEIGGGIISGVTRLDLVWG